MGAGLSPFAMRLRVGADLQVEATAEVEAEAAVEEERRALVPAGPESPDVSR